VITKEDLQEKYAKMKTVDLLQIMANKDNYTDLAVSVAKEELKKRNVPDEEVRNYKPAFEYKPNEKTIENYFVDLNILQKAISYFLIILFYNLTINRFGAARNIYPARHLLKTQQANFYMVTGISFGIAAIITNNIYPSTFIYIWISGFIISWLFDIGFNKQRQINQIQEKVDQGKDPLEF
jgi:hypothetical protein